MAKFKQAIFWLRDGKKVRRSCWLEDSYWILGVDQKICWKDGTTAHIHLNQIDATDWEIYKKDVLSKLVMDIIKKKSDELNHKIFLLEARITEENDSNNYLRKELKNLQTRIIKIKNG